MMMSWHSYRSLKNHQDPAGNDEKEAKPKHIQKAAADTSADADLDEALKMARKFGYDVGPKPKKRRK